jgi:hypothetical protein
MQLNRRQGRTPREKHGAKTAFFSDTQDLTEW